jgi:membrane protein implicated in regulation of membrane protease activity
VLFFNLYFLGIFARWAIHEIAMLLITVAALVLMAIGGVWWPLAAFIAITVVGTWIVKRAARRLFPIEPEPQSLEALCEEQRQISEWAAGNTFADPPPAARRVAGYGHSIHDIKRRERMVPYGR